VSLLAVELEDGFPFEDQVQLLLAARAFVVFFDQRLIGTTRHEKVHSDVSMPSACWSGYQAGSSESRSETVGTEVIAFTVQRAIAGAYAALGGAGSGTLPNTGPAGGLVVADS
jgi:hypothetical protein